MNEDNEISLTNSNYSRTSFRLKKFRFIWLFLSGVILLPIQYAKSEEIYLKCTGKYEINRGELIKPEWETTNLKINLDGLISYIEDKGIKREGRTVIRGDSYTITHRDNRYRVKTKYKINGTHGTYIVEYPKRNRTLIGTCQKGRG
tara:strand:+ start:2719 stop:3156 length:438 start_codon:yes stop_codon:yes gene_type:complete